MHHALATIPLTRLTLLSLFAIPLVTDVLLWFYLDSLLAFWKDFFDFWILLLVRGRHSGVISQTISIFYTDTSVPVPALFAALPSHTAVQVNYIAVGLIFIATFFIPSRFLPLIYFIRAMLLIQFSASMYFTVNPTSFPYTLEGYLVGQLTVGIYMLFLVSPLLALIYYPLDFSLAHKITLTFLVLTYFAIAIPFQYMLQAYIISNWTFLFLPVLYLFFGLLLDVLMFIGWYSWAMTWPRSGGIRKINPPF